MAAVGLAAACGSAPPTVPNVPLSSAEAAVSEGVAAIDRGLPTGSGACEGVMEVVVQVTPIVHHRVVHIVTTYNVPGWEPCLIPPTWEANRRGLRVNAKDPFRAEIDARANGSTWVYATAPNGVVGKIKF
jgi:hypothetical protein